MCATSTASLFSWNVFNWIFIWVIYHVVEYCTRYLSPKVYFPVLSVIYLLKSQFKLTFLSSLRAENRNKPLLACDSADSEPTPLYRFPATEKCVNEEPPFCLHSTVTRAVTAHCLSVSRCFTSKITRLSENLARVASPSFISHEFFRWLLVWDQGSFSSEFNEKLHFDWQLNA